MAKKKPRPKTPYGAPASLYSAPTTASQPHRKIPTSYPGPGRTWSDKGRIQFPTPGPGPAIKASSFEGGRRGPGQFWDQVRRENAAHAPKHPKPPPSIWGKK